MPSLYRSPPVEVVHDDDRKIFDDETSYRLSTQVFVRDDLYKEGKERWAASGTLRR